jgi:hypothetical protein
MRRICLARHFPPFIFYCSKFEKAEACLAIYSKISKCFDAYGPFGITISISAILKKCDFKTQFIKKIIFKIALSVW